MEIDLKPFQDKFLFSEARFNALIAGVGTGKTMLMLLKIWKYCEDFPGSLALIIRREYTDLEASTIKDFNRYFNVNLSAKHEFRFGNRSMIMFKHGKEITPNVLKNFTLDIIGIEQVEEFETETEFTFLRDRLRGKAGRYRQICVVGNTNGHNWIWKKWKNNPQPEFELTEATTFDNQENLPKDFISDLKRMEIESPNHYKRYVMNSWEDLEDSDMLIPYPLIEKATHLNLYPEGQKIMSIDVARFGDDETVFNIIQKANIGWKQLYIQGYHGQDTMQTCGRIIDLMHEYRTNFHIIDDIGVGGGVTDRLRELAVPNVRAFIANNRSAQPEYYNLRDECYWRLKELFERDEIQILNHEKLMTQLSSIKYDYRSTGEKVIVSKDEMKKLGFSSPDYSDALMMSMMVTKFTTLGKPNVERTVIGHYPVRH